MTKQAPIPKTGDHYGFRATGNVAKLGAPNGDHDGFYARYTYGPAKGSQVVLSVKFLKNAATKL